MKREIEQKLINSLTDTLLLKFPKSYFSIGHIMDDGISMYNSGNTWDIVVSDRGNITLVVSYGNLLDACSGYIEQLTMGEDSKELKDIFVTRLFDKTNHEYISNKDNNLIEM